MFWKAFFFLLAFFPVTLSLAQMRIIPHVTRPGGGFTTTLQVENLTAAAQSLTFQPYDASGTALTPKRLDLNPMAVIAADVVEFFEGGAAVSHFEMSGDEGVGVSVAYDFEVDGSPAHVRMQTEAASSWRIFPGDWDHVFDGLAVVNLGTETTELWITQKNFQGEILQTERITTSLPPKGKALYVIGSPDGSSFSRDTDSYFEMSAQQSLAVTALRGTLGRNSSGLLWANEARTLSRSQSKRDDKHTWFITGGSVFDVFEMMGYNVARDRLYQAHLFKFNARGRMAELFGQNFLDSDIFIRKSTYSDEELEQQFAALDEETRTIILGYVHGFNRRISQVNADNDILPYEFRVFNINQVEYWSYKDVLAWLALIQRNFSIDDYGDKQIGNLALAQLLVSQTGDLAQARLMYNDLRWVNDPKAPTVIPADETPPAPAKKLQFKRADWSRLPSLPDIQEAAKAYSDMLDEHKRLQREVGAYVKMGSYGWVVAGSKTQSGNPILYSGPQIDYASPVFVLEGSIQSDEANLHVSGMAVPGIPAFLVGRTPHHAWGFEVGHSHNWDYYMDNQEDRFLHRTEKFKVAGGSETEVEIYRTHHGPILFENPIIFSWKYAHWGHEFDLSGGIMGLARAQNIDEFGEAVAKLGVGQHIFYADREGNIAYWLSGREPVRPPGDYHFPQGSVADQLEYDIEVVNPPVHHRNPEQGWYAGWNSKAVAWADDTSGTFYYGPFQRTHIIHEKLQGRENLTFEDLEDLALTIATTQNFSLGGNQWPFFREKFIEVIMNNPTPERLEIIDLIENSDGHFVDGGRENWLTGMEVDDAWVFQRQWILVAIDLTFIDEIDPNTDFTRSNRRFQTFLHAIDDNPGVVNNYDWFQNNEDPTEPQNLEQVVLESFDFIYEGLGPRPWSGVAGGRGFIIFDHNFLGTLYQMPFFNRSSYTQCVEFDSTGPIRIESGFPMGQAGTILTNESFQPVTEAGTLLAPGQPIEPVEGDHYFSMNELYEQFQLRSYPLFDKKAE